MNQVSGREVEMFIERGLIGGGLTGPVPDQAGCGDHDQEAEGFKCGLSFQQNTSSRTRPESFSYESNREVLFCRKVEKNAKINPSVA